MKKFLKLKIYLEEKNMIIDTLTSQLVEKDKHNEELECEIVGLRKKLRKQKPLISDLLKDLKL